MAADKSVLTNRQNRFCHEYLVDFNGKKAAIRAGYSKKTAIEQASRLLRKVKVQDEIKRLSKKIDKQIDVEVGEILKALKTIAFSDISDFVVIKDGKVKLKEFSTLPQWAKTAIESIQQTRNGVKFKLSNKLSALQLLGKYKGMFIEKNQAQDLDRITSVIELVKTAAKIRKDRKYGNTR